MSVIDEVLAANAAYKETHDASLYSPSPRRHLAVLMCMDTRLLSARQAVQRQIELVGAE